MSPVRAFVFVACVTWLATRAQQAFYFRAHDLFCRYKDSEVKWRRDCMPLTCAALRPPRHRTPGRRSTRSGNPPCSRGTASRYSKCVLSRSSCAGLAICIVIESCCRATQDTASMQWRHAIVNR